MSRITPETRYFVAQYKDRSEVRDRNNPGRGVVAHFDMRGNGPFFHQLAAAHAAALNEMEDLARDAESYRDCLPIDQGGKGC